MSIKPLDLKIASNSLYPFYKQLFQAVIDEHLMSQEQIVFTANSTRHTIYDNQGISIGKMITQEYDITTHKDAIRNEPTLLILTNFRWLRVALEDYHYSHKVRIRNKTSTMGKLFSGEKLKYYWLIPPENSEKWFKNLKQSPREFVAKQIRAIPLSDIYPQIKARRLEYTLHDQKAFPDSTFHLMRVLFSSSSYSLQYDDGLRLQEILQIASINQGRLPLFEEKDDTGENNSEDTIVQKLSYLNQLLEQKLITEAEYQKKKEDLLANL